MVYQSVLEAMGNTPLIKLNHVVTDDMADIFVKMEALNVGGSIKTRTAYNMIQAAVKEGLINKDTIIVEPTSGNQGIGLSLVGATLGIKTIIIMPDSVSIERRKLCSHYGAEVILVHDNNDIGKCIEDCIFKANELKLNNPNVFVPSQFTNINNLLVHKNVTAKEILDELELPIDGFTSGIGTGGTISGVGEALKAVYPNCKVVALEPENAAILSNKPITTHLQMGIGDGLIPDILNQGIIDEVEIITDKEALEMSKRLAKEEGLMVGISSGTNVVGAIRLAKKLGKGKTVVTILPDTAERYVSTELFED